MKRNTRSRSQTLARRGASLSAAVLASVIMAGNASALDIPTGQYTVDGTNPWIQDVVNVGTVGSAEFNVTNGAYVEGVLGGTQVNLLSNNSGVLVSYGAAINGDISGAFGVSTYVNLYENGAIYGNVYLYDGTVHLDTNSYVSNGVGVGIGSILVEGGSGVDNGASTISGDITIRDSGTVVTGTVAAYVDGDINVTDGARVNGNVYAADGDVNVDGGSRVRGDVRTDIGDINVTDGSRIRGNSSQGITSDVLGSLNVSGSSRVRTGFISLNEGSLTVSGSSRVRTNGDIDIALGDINATDSRIRAGGDINLDSGSINATDSLVIAFDDITLVNGDINATRSFVGALDDVRLLNGSINADEALVGAGDDLVLLNGDINAINNSRVGAGDRLVLVNGSINTTDSEINAGDDIVVVSGDIDASNSEVEAGDDIVVVTGNILAANSSHIHADDDIRVVTGDINVSGSSHVRAGDDIRVGTGDIVASGSSRIRAGDDIRVGTGDIIASDSSRISAREDIVVLTGSINASNSSHVHAGDDIYVGTGDIVASGSSHVRASDDITVHEGDIVVSGSSRVRAGDDITIDTGSIFASNGAHVSAGDDIRLFNGSIVAEDSVISARDNVVVANGNIDLTDSDLYAGRGWTYGGVIADNGNINLDGSYIDADFVYNDYGDINVTNYSTIDARTTINDGVLTVDETSDIFGTTRVNYYGIADIEGVIYGNLRLREGTGNRDGGVLVGHNATIVGNVYNNGRIAPGDISGPFGNGVGKINVDGDFHQLPGGTYYADIYGRKSFDQILVTGSAAIAGGDLVINKNNYKPYREDTFNLVQADAGVNVIDAYTVEHNFATNTMLEANVRYRDNAVQLHIHQLSFEKQGKTPNQRSVGRAVDYAAKRDQLDKMFDHLNYTDRSNVPRLLDLLSPEALTTIFNVGFANAQVQNVNIERRLDDVRAGSRGFSANGLALSNNRGTINYDGAPIVNDRDGLSLAGFDGKTVVDKKVVAPVIEENSPWGFFVTGSGEWADVEATDQARGADFASGGVTVGADYRVNDNFVVGLFAGYVHTKSDLDFGGDVKANGARGGLYGSYFNDGFYVNALASGGYNHYKIDRVTVGGTARGKTDGGQFDSLLGAGYDFSVGCFTLGPVGSLQYSYVGFDRFSENGSAAPQTVQKNSQDSLRSLVGAKAAAAWNVGGMVLRPEVRAQWKHEYLDRSAALDSSFTGSGAVFTVNGPNVGRDSLVVDAGAALDVTETVSIYAFYTGELARQNYSSNSVTGGFRLSF